MTVEVEIDVELLKSEIKKTYASVSDEPERDIFPTGRAWAEGLGYPRELANVPEAAVESFAVSPTLGLQDPAYCPDATDKLTLPAGTNGEYPIVGQCQTNAFVIHLRAIPAGGAVPPGYESAGWTTGGATVYYALTAR